MAQQSTNDADRLETFFDACARVSWTEPLWHLTRDTLLNMGVLKVSYHHLPPLGAADEGRIRIVTHGFSEDWVGRYIGKKLYLRDPIPAHAATVEEPFFWHDIARLRNLTETEYAFLELLDDADLGIGLAFPVFGPSGRNGYFGLGFGEDPTGPGAGRQRLLQAICQTAHLRYCRLLRDQRPTPHPLSEREQELLGWVARGKSNSVIAEIMAISPHTVDAYLRRIFLKLGTTDRISAAIQGLATGLIRGY